MVSRELGWALHVPRLCFVQLKTSRGRRLHQLALAAIFGFYVFLALCRFISKERTKEEGIGWF